MCRREINIYIFIDLNIFYFILILYYEKFDVNFYLVISRHVQHDATYYHTNPFNFISNYIISDLELCHISYAYLTSYDPERGSEDHCYAGLPHCG